MPRLRIPGSRNSTTLTSLFAVFAFLCGSPATQSQTNDKTPLVTENQAPIQLKVASNLVVVRVIVRDAQGKPVEGLRKEDFHLFDRSKEQTIAQFEEEDSPQVANLPVLATPGQPAAPVTPRLPRRFLVLYFDDLDMSETDVIDARDAADRYLATNLQPDERVAMFTSSAMLSDFTVDLKQLHDGLFRLHPHPHMARHSECPDLSDYQAQEISEHENPNTSDAWKAALDEAVNRCHMPKNSDTLTPGVERVSAGPSDAAGETISLVRSLARSIMDASQIQARMSLQGLDQVVNIMARAPGQRSVILVSPGFLSHNDQYHLDRIIDRALRSQVVVNSLDPRGLALLMREADVTNGYAPTAASGVVGSQHAIDTNREMVAQDVLAEVAEGTGGEFFHNNNDLTAGFRALAGLQGSYILAFAPTDAKQDGKFHSLKVTLTEKHSGITLQARRGYYAEKEPTIAEEPPTLETRPISSPTLDAAAREKERIRQAVLSKIDQQELPVQLQTEVSKASDTEELGVLAHLDTKALHFHKEGERNQNTVTFISVIYDGNGKYLTGQQREARVDIPDDTLPKLLASGMEVKIVFQLRPGTYTIREVVTDSEEHQMTALSHNVTIP